MRVLAAICLPLTLAGCLMPQVYVTSLGPLRISPDSEMTIINADAAETMDAAEPLPLEGGLVVRTLNGRPVPFEARDAALEALEAHCLDQYVQGVPYFFGWRVVNGAGHWTAAGCDT